MLKVSLSILIIFVNFFDLIFYYEKFYQVFIDRDKMFFIAVSFNYSKLFVTFSDHYSSQNGHGVVKFNI